MRIGIFAPAHSRQTQLLSRALDDIAPGAAVWLNPNLGPDHRVAIDGAALSWNGAPLTQFDALLIHGFAYEDPVIPPADPLQDWSLWQAGPLIAQQRYSFLYSLLARLEAVGGPRLYNPLSSAVAAFARFTLLDRLRLAGAAIPDLICANDPAAAAAFCARHPTVVWRPMTGQAGWQLFRDRQRQALIGRDQPPVMLAAVAPGPLVRVSVLDGQAVLALETAPPARDELERLEVMFPSRSLSAPQLAAIAAAVAGLGLRWATALVVATANGPVFYDVDPDPVATDLPDCFRDRLLRRLAAALAGAPAPAEADAPSAAARPALLLRRMLAIQFDMEQTKYAD